MKAILVAMAEHMKQTSKIQSLKIQKCFRNPNLELQILNYVSCNLASVNLALDDLLLLGDFIL